MKFENFRVETLYKQRFGIYFYTTFYPRLESVGLFSK